MTGFISPYDRFPVGPGSNVARAALEFSRFLVRASLSVLFPLLPILVGRLLPILVANSRSKRTKDTFFILAVNYKYIF